MSGLLLLAVIGLLRVGAVSGARGLFAGQGPRALLRSLGTSLLLAAVLAVQPAVHELGLRCLIALQRETLETAAQEALATARDDEYLWRTAFDIWPAFLGPTRAAAWRQGELLFLDFEGSPDAAVGLCYNLRHLAHRGLQHAAGRPLVPIPLVKKPWRPQRTRA
ncbi:hypothetical protein H5407_07040 [Mitsuaria sp. WAJ17]|uniref:hypothetical protein n=1 Tax=Mitsuaria sp. WAJ17 TaxID=2761452 RepID=UPI0016041D86|nr:hypothetical protein [Mitsuaria sp. WAJ17]MBB2484983.1 hypothetical protein [Mitsuaria sp. WAJ17]